MKYIKEGYITPKNAGKNHTEFKSDINEILKGGKQLEQQKSAVKNIKTLYQSWKIFIKLFDDYFRIVSEAKYKVKFGECLKILTLKEMRQKLP